MLRLDGHAGKGAGLFISRKKKSRRRTYWPKVTHRSGRRAGREERLDLRKIFNAARASLPVSAPRNTVPPPWNLR